MPSQPPADAPVEEGRRMAAGHRLTDAVAATRASYRAPPVGNPCLSGSAELFWHPMTENHEKLPENCPSGAASCQNDSADPLRLLQCRVLPCHRRFDVGKAGRVGLAGP